MSTDETWFDQLKFFERATELVVYTLVLEDLITLESEYPTFCRIKAGRDVDYSFLTEHSKRGNEVRHKSSGRKKSRLGKNVRKHH